MSAAVGAALKRISVALLSNKKTLKNAAIALLSVVLAFLLPTVAVLGVFSGSVEIDVEDLERRIVENLSGSDAAMLRKVENTMHAISRAMIDAGQGNRTKEAQVLYIMALYDQSGRADFVTRLTTCFSDGQSDAQLIRRVNSIFGTEIDANDFTNVMKSIRAVQIDSSDFTDPGTKNNLDLVSWAISAEEAGWGYVWGTYGQVLTRKLYESKLAQYPEEVGGFASFIESNWLGGRTADCIGLIKGYGWYSPETGEIHYGTNGMPDVGANAMFNLATEKGTISKIPEIPGLAVWHEGHIGIYIGQGEVVEAMGTRYGVVKTKLQNRRWTHWLKIPCITYLEETNPTETEETP